MALIMGFASGLPLLLTGSVLQAWMVDEGVDLSTIGLFALVGLPYTLKFLWAPILDRYTLPFFGRRRGWLFSAQLFLILSLVYLSLQQPGIFPFGVAIAALLVTFFSASQDIVIDAYRRETLADNEQGLGASFYVNGYRIGMLLASGGGLILADMVAFSTVYQLMAGVMFVASLSTLIATEPKAAHGQPKTLQEAIIQPFLEFFQRREAIVILLFILLYKMGDTMASNMTTPFYLDIGFTRTEIGTVVKLFGFWATILGGLLGGFLILKTGIYRALWGFGILQAISTAGFIILNMVGPNLSILASVIAFENLSAGMGTAAFIGFMASQTDKRFTATQYALLTSLMGVPRVLIAAPTGWMAEIMGWNGFFLLCTLIAIPGLLVLRRFKNWTSASQ
ncbi:MAG: AmpG family muropeptide MFS transporter [Cycloclasticus sp.]|nr:MAG: AmpG family muropeptide MFS transporter [Cycloclasticus sp.]